MRGGAFRASPSRMMRSFLGSAIVLLALVGAAVAAPPHRGGDRHRAVGGWIVEDKAEDDGGRLVELRRETGGIHIRYFVAFWRGNDGRVQGTMVERSDCTNGDEIGRHVVLGARALRTMLARTLADCAVPPRRIAALLAGLEPAYALTLAWARDAEAATAAEAAAIANYGAEDRSGRPHRR
jgi:hypothetical protein